MQTPHPTPIESAITSAARAAQRAWAARPWAQRQTVIAALRRQFVARRQELCTAVEVDLARPPAATLTAEILSTADALLFLEKHAGRILAPRRVPGSQKAFWLFGQSDTVYRRPRGVVGLIGTWNYPIFLNMIPLAQAIAAGNAVIWKPSEVTSATTAALAALLAAVDLPNHLVTILPATRDLGARLAESEIDHVHFTGHESTGRRLAARLGERLITSTLELSGHDAQLVLDDADPILAARAAWFAATSNAGQTCVAIRRSYVHRGILPAFLEALRPLASTAPGMKLAMPRQAEQAATVIAAALSEGAELLVPRTATDNESNAFRPAVLVNVKPTMAVSREALFAPVFSVQGVDSVEEAVRLNHECPYGLALSVFTGDPERVTGLAADLNAGLITVNDAIIPMVQPGTPFGGRCASGWGVSQGQEGLLEMTVAQTVSVRKGTWRPHYEPPGQSKNTSYAFLEGLLLYTHGATARERWSGLWRLIRGG